MSNTVLFELGLEEMPARFMDDALHQLHSKTISWLKDHRIPYGTVAVFSTPRRLAVKITEVESKQPDIEEEAKGPAKNIALTEAGEWTKAAIGFSKGQGKTVDDIYFKEINGTDYVHVTKFIKGTNTSELFREFKDVFLSLTFPKNMRWGTSDLKYARPIRWITALFGKEIIPFEIEGVHTSSVTFGHRFLGSELRLEEAGRYEETLEDQFVLVNVETRKEKIRRQLHELEKENHWQLVLDEELLNEVTHLVEYPTVFSGSFNETFLEVPEEALITSMKEHQRYFPVRNHQGELLAHFAGVRNGNEDHIDIVAKGNEKVLKARLSDAQFFFEEDQKTSIHEYLAKLNRMVYQEELGTLRDKVDRIVAITEKLCSTLKLDESTGTLAKRAAEICKFDLVTHMVDEFSELQGVMGEKYARLFGEDEAVAAAVNEHYMPRQANGKLPETETGSIVSLADKLDTIAGSIGIGNIPTGSQDPYGLRRQALGILETIQKQQWSVKLEDLIELVLSMYEELNLSLRPLNEVKEDLFEFFKLRAEYLLKEAKVDPDIVEAVLAEGVQSYPFTLKKANLLMQKRQDEAFKEVHEALGRVLNLAKKAGSEQVNINLFQNQSEKELYEAYQSVHDSYLNALARGDAETALFELSGLASVIHRFFDETMVMTDEEDVRKNRLALLQLIANDILLFADINAVQWKQHY
ncbi:glycine--tRNA ligase subunit beta [Halobacillus salinarum]|uniref:Glycine--tRNA ligase beta subunit n=1 Tax=Halobacillus salinarum TaxID=2932257 RepID=A0ABY4EKA4_9BACI|nr:glycine--tRNA ligase subunit beta [Halobacillus salinarum]UOQ42491.1 glycine--tRNA ligase subunit beta [Halobacillus salinarum]